MVDVSRVVLAVDSSQVRQARGDMEGLSKSGRGAESASLGLGKALLGLAAGAAAVKGIASQFGAVVREGELLQRNMLRTEQLIKSTGQAAGFSAQQLQEQARQLAMTTLQSTEGVMEAQQILLTFRKVTGDTFTRATELAADLATVTGGSLSGAMTQLGKALEDPVQGINAMTRSGVSFSEQQKELIKDLVATGRAAEAQTLILDELAGQYGGVAKTEAQGLAGAQDSLSQAIQEVRIAIASFSGVTDVLASGYRRASDVIFEVTAQLSSGELQTRLYAFWQPLIDGAVQAYEMFRWAFTGISEIYDSFFRWAGRLVGNELQGWEDAYSQTFSFIKNSLMELPSNFADFVRLATVEIASLADRAKSYGRLIAEFLDPRVWFSEQRRALIAENFQRDIDMVNALRFSSISAILDERSAREAATSELLMQSKAKRAAWEAERAALDAYTPAVVAAVTQITAVVAEQGETAEEVAQQHQQSAQVMQSAWTSALEQTAARIDGAFAEAWKGAFKSFGDFADSLKNAFRQLLGELAHLALTRPIVMNIAAALGLGGASGSALASGGGGIGGIGSMLSGGVGKTLTGLEGMFAKMGFQSGANFMYGVQGGLDSTGQLIGMGQGAGAAITAGAGIAGTLLAGQLFNRSSTTGGALGGTAGGLIGASLGGPFGAPIGALLGSVAGSGIGGLLGGKGPRGETIGVGAGGLRFGGDGKDADKTAATAAALEIASVFAQMVGSGANVDVQSRRGSAFRVNGQKVESIGEALDMTMKLILDGATNLEPALRTLVTAFKGTAEETIAYTQALMSIRDMAGVNSVDAVIKAFNTEQQNAIGLYRQQTNELNRLIDNFDGSSASASALNNALGIQKSIAAELAGIILATQSSIDSLIGSSIKSIQESIMTQEQLRASREAERLALRQGLGMMTDPREIERTVREVERLNRQIFDSYSPEDQVRLAGEFIKVLEDTQRLADRQLETTLQQMSDDQNSINERIMTGLDASAAAMQQASQSFAENVALFGQFVNGMNRGGELAF